MRKMKMSKPSYKDANQKVASVMANVTSGLRFPGELNSSLRKQAVNLIPFPRLHFFMDAVSSITKNDIYKKKKSTSELFWELFDR
jgi:tubulin beta